MPPKPTAPDRRSSRLAEVTARHWQLLRAIPRTPRRVDVATMVAQLAEVGVAVHARTVQRDLERLEPLVPALSCDRRSKPFGWFWAEDVVAPLDGPGTTLASAVVLELVERLMGGALPPDLELAIRRRLPAAREVLARASEHRWVIWVERVARRAQDPSTDSRAVRTPSHS